MKIELFLLAWSSSLVCDAGAARILALLGTPTLSHHIVIRVLVEELAHRGHDIVSLTANPVSYSKDSFKGTIKVIDVQNVSYRIWQQKVNRTNFYSRLDGNYKIFNAHLSALPSLVDVQLEEPEMKRILRDKSEVFDLVLVQNMIPTHYAAAARFKAPLVTFMCGVGNNIDYEPIGVPTQPLFYTNFMNKNILNIDFLSKLHVLLFSYWMDLIIGGWLPVYTKSAIKYFGPNVPTTEEMLTKVSVALSNIHPETHGIRPNVPSLVHVGSINFKPRKELTPELKQYLDQSPNGVIYISFGTMTNSNSLTSDKTMMFNQVFARLPYNFIWKWDGDALPGKSENILLVKWVSQQDLLGHPNVKAFITHAGINSIDESIYNQVPVVSIPFAVDQFRNAKVAEHLGIGLALDYSSLTEDMLYNAIMKVTENSSFRINLRHLSMAVKDKPRPGLELAVWWIEYVLRHNGTDHLRAPIMNIYEYLLLDVFAFMLVSILVPIFIVHKLSKITLH